MKNIKIPIFLTTALLMTYAIIVGFDSLWKVSMILFGLLYIALIWMVICILKYGKPSPHTFDERFYEDRSNDQLDVF
jgi:hypothetical protein